MAAPTSSAGAFSLEVRPDQVAVLTFDQPGARANTLSRAVLDELDEQLTELEVRTGAQGLVFRSGKPGMFIAGADVRELADRSLTPDRVRELVKRGLDLFARIEALPYPTVAAVDGSCMGGGLELALAFDFRLAGRHPKTELACPEVKLGIVPGWGGTQRLARIVGPAPAAELICTGEGVKPDRARDMGLVFDAVPSERLIDEAVQLVAWARQSGAWQAERRRKRQPVGLTPDQHAFTFAVARAQVLAKTKGVLPAPLAALGAIAKGCILPLDEGLAVETDAFVPLVGSPVSRNLIAVFFMTQRLQKDAGVADPTVQPRSVERVGVIGAGLMGAGIAAAHVRRGIPVAMVDNAPGAIEKGMASISKVLQGRGAAGRAASGEVVAAIARLSAGMVLAALADRDLVIEAIVENEEAKVATYRQLEPLLAPDALLASNTSTISISRMAKAVSRPENFAGMHFFNPVDRMPLVEVVRGEATGDRTVATLVALAKRIGKTPIVVRDCPGFVVNRILFTYLNESLALLEEGAEPRAVDRAATTFGMPMGPLALNDLVGLDTSLYAGRVINSAFPDRAVSTRLLDELVQAGRLGQKSGAGFYAYAKGPRGADDPAFAEILGRVRSGRRTFSEEELTDRLFLPMVTEASRILEEGIVRDPGDVDMGMVLGTGFPAYRGGLLRWADGVGLGRILQRLARYEGLGKRFQPTEQMRRLAAAGRGFYSD